MNLEEESNSSSILD